MKAKFLFIITMLFWLSSGAQTQIDKYAYWIDGEVSAKVIVDIANTSVLELQTSLDLSGLEDGLHTIQFVFIDDSGRSSPVVTDWIYTGTSDNEIVGLEYWVDDDVNFSQYQQLSPSNEVLVDLDLDVSLYTLGMHNVKVRFKDNAGQWSAVQSFPFFFNGMTTSMAHVVSEYRYRIDTVWSNWMPLNNSGYTVDHSQDIDMSNIPVGPHRISYMFKTNLEVISPLTTDTFYRAGVPVAGFTVPVPKVCVGDTVFFVNMSQEADSMIWDLGNGQTSDLYDAYAVYNAPGFYDVTLWAFDSYSQAVSQADLNNAVEVVGETVADFNHAFNGLTVSFLNLSTYADAVEWNFGDGQQSFDMNPVHTYAAAGTYSVELNVSGFCNSDNQTKSIFLDIGVIDRSGITAKLYPNPSHSDAFMELSALSEQELDLEIIDALGQSVFADHFMVGSNPVKVSIPSADWPAGVYIIRLSSQQGTTYIRFISQ